MLTIKNNVKKYRLEQGFTQIRFCKQVGITQAYLSQIENGQRSMSIPVAAKIALVLGITLDELIIIDIE